MSRPGAILDLTHDRIDDEDRRITLNAADRRQTKKFRPIVPITNSPLPWLRSAPRSYEQRKRGEVVATWPITHLISYCGRPIRSLKTAWGRLRDAAEPDNDVTPYSIRHTMGRELRRRRVPSEEISIMLGHLPVGVQRVDLTYSPFDPD